MCDCRRLHSCVVIIVLVRQMIFVIMFQFLLSMIVNILLNWSHIYIMTINFDVVSSFMIFKDIDYMFISMYS